MRVLFELFCSCITLIFFLPFVSVYYSVNITFLWCLFKEMYMYFSALTRICLYVQKNWTLIPEFWSRCWTMLRGSIKSGQRARVTSSSCWRSLCPSLLTCRRCVLNHRQFSKAYLQASKFYCVHRCTIQFEKLPLFQVMYVLCILQTASFNCHYICTCI